MATYPYGYGTGRASLAELQRRYGDKMHPEFARRFWAWLESMDGKIGVGSGWRRTPHDVSRASRNGWSLHQDQRYAGGFVGYAAVDLVVGRGGGKAHRSPLPGECSTAKQYGLHIPMTYEPWHIQCIEQRGYWSWRNAGRPDPDPNFLLPSTPTSRHSPNPEEDDEMKLAIRWRHPDYQNIFLFGAGDTQHLTPLTNAHYASLGVPLITEAHDQALKSALGQCRLGRDALVKV